VLAPGATPGRTYVCVMTSVETCVRRLDARPGKHSRLQSPGLLRDDRSWTRAESIRRALVAALIAADEPSGAPPRVILADGSRDPEASAVQVLAMLRTPRAGPRVIA
jgi:hypothetical protein